MNDKLLKVRDEFTFALVKMYSELELYDKVWDLEQKRDYIKNNIVELIKIVNQLCSVPEYVIVASSKTGLDFDHTNPGNISWALWRLRYVKNVDDFEKTVNTLLYTLFKAVK
jgi:hypothetical protein